MPPEALEEARGWLIKATRDLQAAEYLATAEVPLQDVIVYHCQQAMEKALKGYLTARNAPFARTHALGPLVEQASDLDQSLTACSITPRA
jgi:HEPN domain-containing protein